MNSWGVLRPGAPLKFAYVKLSQVGSGEQITDHFTVVFWNANFVGKKKCGKPMGPPRPATVGAGYIACEGGDDINISINHVLC